MIKEVMSACISFFALYIYTVFAQIGYAYFPELSDVVGAYFGPTLFYKYWAFIFFLSFLPFCYTES